ncbi:alpha/beta hydrolase family protein [Ceratobasidium sp. AG-Ba]|nr:alpha/beta hydrolase family protein [Ceratobasidium sp. AG-Ba]
MSTTRAASEPDPTAIPLPETPPAVTQAKSSPHLSLAPPSSPNTKRADDQPSTSTALTLLPPPELVLCIFIHGFKGTDSTFGAFPHRVGHLVEQVLRVGRGYAENLDLNQEGPESESLASKVTVECLVFPAYETRGNLEEAVEKFVDWLTTLTVQKEVAHHLAGGSGKAKIILCGHSMGGLIAADALLSIARWRPEKDAPLWPWIVGCVAFDTPYYGLHPSVFSNQASKAVDYASAAQQAFSAFNSLRPASPSSTSQPIRAAIMAPPTVSQHTKSSSPWATWVPAVGGVILAGAAAGTAYWKRKEVVEYGAQVAGVGTWLKDHMQYIGNLWDEKALAKRVDSVMHLVEQGGVAFFKPQSYYTVIPPTKKFPRERTFIILPPKSSLAAQKGTFIPAPNALAADEIAAHIGMFEPQSNDGYYSLGLRAAENVCGAVAVGREIGAQWEAITGPEGSKKAVQDKEEERIEKKTEEEKQKLDAGHVPQTEPIPPDGRGSVADGLRGDPDPPAPPPGSSPPSNSNPNAIG